MTDADLIYNALLRVEKFLEGPANDPSFPQGYERARVALFIVELIRGEIGNGLAREGR